MNGGGGNGAGQVAERARSKSVMDGRTQFTREGRAILHFGEFYMRISTLPFDPVWGLLCRRCSGVFGGLLLTGELARAMYTYQAAIPEELSFAKGDVLAVLRLQDDGWWEAEGTGKKGARGLVPSNYLVAC